jgi:hypothetical protein
MDGPEGEEHVHLGAKIMGLLFGDWWADFTLRHSRYWAKRNGVSVSKLCYADKLAFAMTPGWLYLPMARATGELAEYMAKSRDRQAGCAVFTETERINLNRGIPRNGLKGCKATRGVGSRNTRAADRTHGPSWLTATQQDDGGIELARKSWRRFGKWPRRILMINKPSGKVSSSARPPWLSAFVLHYAVRQEPYGKV